ncbi:MAG: hypothetical protein OEM52_04725 [bacterium]|nr:hypothetical protein [bacterium]
MSNQTSFWEKISRIDRRWIFLTIAITVSVPMILGVDFAAVPSPMVEDIFHRIEQLPAGSRVLLSYDYGPSTVPENQPMADALAYHLLKRGCKVYMMAVWATGERQATVTMERVVIPSFPKAVYGDDYIDLGYKAGNTGLMNLLFTNFKRMYTTDRTGKDIESFPMMQQIESLRSFNMIFSISSGQPGLKEWVQFVGDRGKIPTSGGVTAVQATELYPYYPRQMFGLMAGLQGAAEFESMVIEKYPEYAPMRTALRKMAPQTVAHIAIIVLVVLGNIAYFTTRKRGK